MEKNFRVENGWWVGWFSDWFSDFCGWSRLFKRQSVLVDGDKLKCGWDLYIFSNRRFYAAVFHYPHQCQLYNHYPVNHPPNTWDKFVIKTSHPSPKTTPKPPQLLSSKPWSLFDAFCAKSPHTVLWSSQGIVSHHLNH